MIQVIRRLALTIIGLSLFTPAYNPTAQAKQVAAQAKGQAAPNPLVTSMLIRSTLIAVNHANLTNNYAVLRSLSSPSFQRVNSGEKLSRVFAKLRRKKFDLSPVVLYRPILAQPATVQRDGRLRLTGFFDTKPARVAFDLLYTRLADKWKLEAIAVNVGRPAKKR